MAVNNLKDFNNQWVMFGLLFFCLLTFAVTFTYNNNSDALGNSKDKFSNYTIGVQSKLMVIEDDSNNLLNISAQNNPEVSLLGSKDSVATSYGIFGTARSFLDSSISFMGWIFTGTTGQLLITVFMGIFGISGIYFITKWIRNGL